MAEQSTFGIKMDTERKNDWQQRIAASGMTAAEYLDSLAAAYDATTNQDSVVNDSELRLIETHLTRIREVAVNMAKARQDENESAENRIVNLQEQLKNAKAGVLDARTEARRSVEAITDKMQELQTELANVKAAADADVINAVNAKEKIEMDADKSRRMFEILEQTNQQLKKQLDDNYIEAAVAKSQLEDIKTELKAANEAVSQAEAETAILRRQLADLKQRYEIEKREAAIEAQAATLTMRMVMMDELEALRREVLELKTAK